VTLQEGRRIPSATSSAEGTVQLHQQQQQSSTGHQRLDNGPAGDPAALGKHVQSMIAQVRGHLAELRDDARDVQLWIQLMTPNVSDGNNMGVDIQNDVKDYVKEAEVSICATLHLSRFFQTAT